MSDDAPRNAGGRPLGSATGQKKLRTLRMGPIWDQAEQAALEIARREGKVRVTKDRETGETVERGNVTAFVEEAIRRELARLERQALKGD